MDEEKRDTGTDTAATAAMDGRGKAERTKSEVDGVLKKCLEENKGDSAKCKSVIEAFKSSSSSSSSAESTRKPITPLRLRSGSLTDV
ncbi:hypothetical protein NMG60_11029048 [Bertholletia excelsa]